MSKGSHVQRLLRRIEWRVEDGVREYEVVAELGERIHALEERLGRVRRQYSKKRAESQRWSRLLIRIVDALDVSMVEHLSAVGSPDDAALADPFIPADLYDVIVEAKHALVEEFAREGGRSIDEVIQLVRARTQRDVGGAAGKGSVIEVG